VRSAPRPFSLFLILTLLSVSSLTAVTIQSMTNKVKSSSVSGAGDLLLVRVATGIYSTRGSADPTLNITPSCGDDTGVVIRLDAVTPTEILEQALIKQVIATAHTGPYRILFLIEEGDCSAYPGTTATHPVATGVKIVQAKQ